LPPPPAARPAKPAKSPEEQAAAAWKKARGGLFWVLFALFWFGLIGFIPAGKVVYERSVGPLPKGDGADWIAIEGTINTPGPDSVHFDKTEIIDVLAFGVPILLGGLMLSMGRVTAGAVPRNSGAKGLFAFSGLITLAALAGIVTWYVCERVSLNRTAFYGLWTAKIGVVLGEFWFLLALAGAGATLRRPAAVRSVGLFSLLMGIAVALYFFGWESLVKEVGPRIGRPKNIEPGSDWEFYQAVALGLGCLALVGAYWRAVGNVRGAISDHLRD
jgi:hypothetical protein